MQNEFNVVQAANNGIRSAILKKDAEELSKLKAEIKGVICTTEEEIIDKAKDADILIWEGCPAITRRVLEALPKLKAVLFGHVGYDMVMIDVDAATENGVIVTNAPSSQWCVEEVSNHAIALLLVCAKKLVSTNNYVKQGSWDEARQNLAPIGPIYGQTLGIIGCGNIGRMVAKKAQCFSLKVVGYDPYVDKSLAKENGITLLSLPELLKDSDYISVHTNLTKETFHMIGEKQFRQMKSTVYFDNVCRGKVVDEKALIKALEEKWIAGAGLDVFEEEPVNPDNPLLKMDNVVTLPHYGSISDISIKKPRAIVLQEAVRILSGHWPINVVNKTVKPKVNLINTN